MSNIALNKVVEENISNSYEATNGESTNYTDSKGFAYFSWPGYLTVDLADTLRIHCIRFLLWDGLGSGPTKRNHRIYKYRLLNSLDHRIWEVLYDTGEEGYNGWQVFNFPDGIQSRYIRIHGIYNSVNEGFHVVQIEAYDSEAPALNADIILEKTITSVEQLINEKGDGLPITSTLKNITTRIENLISSSNLLNPEPFSDLLSQLKEQVRDVLSIERSMQSIRKEIVSPVKNELENLGKVGKISFWVGIAGGILAIISIFITLFK